ncbi:acyltransferase family protein [Streptomyces sp. NPDC008150]|uniref:acyltransferase family protein n=1 Tax=Streptomyces sp. NPDC008150 TaxID=3364816 RepID=UPI0036E1496E
MTHSPRPHDHSRTPLPAARRPEPGAPGAAAPPAAPSAPPPGRQRDAFFDNAKYLAIVLVAMGHSWEPLKSGHRVLEAVYMVVYALHMPAFIVISGFFSRNFEMRPDKIKRLITGVAVPYIVFETAYPLFKRWVFDSPDQEISLLDPWFLTWFLAALFIWRLTTPLWRTVRWPLPLALVVAMLATLSPSIGDDLDLQRVLQFLPYFVLGLCLKPEHFRAVRSRRVRAAAGPVFAAALVTAWWAVPRMNAAWFYHRDSARELGAPSWVGPVMVLALFGCSLVLTACFYSWVPGRRTWFTSLGAGTLYGYLLHGFLIKGADYAGWFDHARLHRPAGELLVTVLAGAAVTLLCTAPVRKVFRCVMEPRMDWAFKRDQGRPAARGAGTAPTAVAVEAPAARERAESSAGAGA